MENVDSYWVSFSWQNSDSASYFCKAKRLPKTKYVGHVLLSHQLFSNMTDHHARVNHVLKWQQIYASDLINHFCIYKNIVTVAPNKENCLRKFS